MTLGGFMTGSRLEVRGQRFETVSASTLHTRQPMAIPDLFQERSFGFAVHILKLFRHLLSTTDVPRHLAQQMLRAGTSIAANLEEAKSAYSRRDLAAKQAIALRDSRECRCWLRLIVTDQPQTASEVRPAIEECSQLIALRVLEWQAQMIVPLRARLLALARLPPARAPMPSAALGL
jgi:four helix bundle protein